MIRENAWKSYTSKELSEMDVLIDRYKKCIDMGKTERECVKIAQNMAENMGYKNLSKIIEEKSVLKAGDKVYSVMMEKSIVLFNIGAEDFEKGMNILGAHIDSPRIDIKQNPLYENSDLAYLDTHYYGGIKKYQWVTIPLAIHGVVAKKNGNLVDIVIGEEDSDPVLVISDLLVHLAQDQTQKKASIVIEGENMDVLVGSKPLLNSDDKDLVKANILYILKEKYGIDEEDFLSAELEIVPAGKARDCGLDRSMVMAYGQDDRVCAFTSLFAMLEGKNTNRTTCCILVDKEEIGSTGATGMQSMFFEDIVSEIANILQPDVPLAARRALRNSAMLSSDVSAAYDPLYSSVFEKRNSAYFGRGIVFNKYTGSRGKSGTNDANAEYIASLRKIMDDNKIFFQTAELGKVDQGGGGTIAHILARQGMRVIDSGVAVMSMHAPYEITSKADIYEAYKAYKAFLLDMK
ncbi:aminopeptidase [Peptostreptococcus equinus]|uniref:M18 family aminopeptidase n=1 Tax=Peptostreptococcus equinus TaxID=3003601 RepID=A0ABY7JQU2_9FIRM|nr:aminopeptidase [Peptostreptococcus sp. CBA3647]WAW14543.1 aminopeptidase [Peptostreptococcus sp. CBA3647]